MRLCSRPNLPPQDLAAVFNAKFDRRTENKKAPSYKLLRKFFLEKKGSAEACSDNIMR